MPLQDSIHLIGRCKLFLVGGKKLGSPVQWVVLKPSVPSQIIIPVFSFSFHHFPSSHFLKNYFIVVQLQLNSFSLPPSPPTPTKPTSLPCFHPPLWFCPCVLYGSSWKPFSPLSLPHSLLDIVRLFLTSVTLVIFCFLFSFVYYVPIKGEIIWYLSHF